MKGILVIIVVVAVFGTTLGFSNRKTKELPECEIGGQTIFPNPEDCSTFYVCSNEGPILRSCPGGLWFNAELLVCDLPENIPPDSCVPPEVITSTEQNTTL